MRAILLFLCLSVPLAGGCARIRHPRLQGYETIKASPTRNTRMAKAKHAKAIVLLEAGQLSAAEQMVNEALLEDREFGPAHNTLGKIYFDQQKLYLAAWEFEFAIKAMPSRAEPLNNLGLVMEEVGQFNEAVNYYSEARLLDEENAEYLGNLVRAMIRRGDDPLSMQNLLQDLVLADSRPDWAKWARSLMVDNEIAIDKMQRDSKESNDDDKEEIKGQPQPHSVLPRNFDSVVDSVEGGFENLNGNQKEQPGQFKLPNTKESSRKKK